MKEKASNVKEQMYSWILSELQMAEAAGIAFRLDGKTYTTAEAARLHMVMEDGYYMKSYEDDESGKIVQVDFEHIRNV